MTTLVERRIYGRRQSHRIRPARKRLLEERLPELQVQIPSDGSPIDLGEVFSQAGQRCWLEVGFGGGEHLAEQAAAWPEIGLIGCEPYVNGVARLLSLINDADNVRVVIDDARLLLKALPKASIEKIFVLFPDPWPKTRHQKRRIVNPENPDGHGTTAEAWRRAQTGDRHHELCSPHARRRACRWPFRLAGGTPPGLARAPRRLASDPL